MRQKASKEVVGIVKCAHRDRWPIGPTNPNTIVLARGYLKRVKDCSIIESLFAKVVPTQRAFERQLEKEGLKLIVSALTGDRVGYFVAYVDKRPMLSYGISEKEAVYNTMVRWSK